MVYTAILILAASALVRHANALPTQPAVDIDVHIDGIAQHPLAAILSARRDHGRGRPWRDDCQFYPGEERRPGYDCEHSQHWNYHRGYSNTDGPQKRSLETRRKPDKVKHRKQAAAGTHKAAKAGKKLHLVASAVDRAEKRVDKKTSLQARAFGSPLMPRRHRDRYSYDGWFEHGRWHRHRQHWYYARAETEEKKSTRVPGFVEVAMPLRHSIIAKTVAGLVTSAAPNSNGSFEIGSSDAHASQFYLTTYDSSAESQIVQLHVPILDSKTMDMTDYCATFPLAPPSTLTLERCGKLEGFSQDFAYDRKTGELSPLLAGAPVADLDDTKANFIVDSEEDTVEEPQPLPHNLLIKAIDTAADSDSPAPPSASASALSTSAFSSVSSFASPTTHPSSSSVSIPTHVVFAALSPSSTGSASAAAPTGVDAEDGEEEEPTMGLYFIPVESVQDGDDEETAAPSSASSSASDLATPTELAMPTAAIFAAVTPSTLAASASSSAALSCTTTITCPSGGL